MEGRLYPRNGFAAHVIGYVGEVSEQELNSPDFAKYSQGDVVGKFGLERQYNDTLIGVDGQRRGQTKTCGQGEGHGPCIGRLAPCQRRSPQR